MSDLPEVNPSAGDASSRWASAPFTYVPRTVSHDRSWQRERLTAADVDPDRYGDTAETGLFGLDCFVSMVDAGLDIDGYVFVDQEFKLVRPTRLGEALQISGEVLDTRVVARGLLVDEVYRFHDASGKLCIETRLRGVASLPLERLAGSALSAMPGRTPQPVGDWTQLEAKRLSPDKVRRFSEDVGNDIHFDIAAAQAHGFRAPLAQGVMSAVYLLGALARERMPRAFDATIEFMRPVFWDSHATLWQCGQSNAAHPPIALQSRNADNKVTAQMSVRGISYD